MEHPGPDRGISFGDGVFETIRVEGGQILFWEAHRDRLTAALQTLDLCLPCSWADIIKQAHFMAARCPYGRLKVLVIRAGEGAYTPPTQEALLWLSLQQVPENPHYPLGPEQRLVLYPYARLVESPWSRFKTLSALPYVQAARYAAKKGFTDAILLSAEGYLAETSRANLFWYDGKYLYTPPLSTGAVQGILRGQILASARQLHIPAQESLAMPEALLTAQEVFTTNVIQGIAPVKQVKLSDRFERSYPAPELLPHLASQLQKVIFS